MGTIVENAGGKAIQKSTTYTPALTGTGTAGTYVYGLQDGDYTVCGNLVFLRAYIQISSTSSPGTGSTTITGIPSDAAAGSDPMPLQVALAANLAGTNGGLHATITGQTITIYKEGSSGAAAILDIGNDIGNDFEVLVSGVYPKQ